MANFPLPKAHWTPRYVVSRIRQGIWEKRNPELPWLTKTAVGFLSEYLRAGDSVVEFGSGRSTLWFRSRIGETGRIVSVEHNAEWHAEVQRRISARGLANVTLILAENQPEKYVAAAAAKVEPQSADFILIDGVHRDACGEWALGAIKPGGIIGVDNVQRYLPHDSRCPHALPPGAPAAGPKWAAFWSSVAGWRRYWTTDGVNDTAFFFCPRK